MNKRILLVCIPWTRDDQVDSVTFELAGGVEDITIRFAEAWLLANDSTVNAPAFPSQPNLRITSVFAPLHGSVSLQLDALGQTQVVFVPETKPHGPASISYAVADQYDFSSNANVSLKLAAVNVAPVAVGETASTLSGIAAANHGLLKVAA